MAGPRLDPAAIQDLMWSDDEDFEAAVSGLNMRGLLDLVTALQNAMAGEQRRFDELSVLLQRLPDSESVEHKKISAALCTSQMRLARLCTRNMRCFTQQAVRAKKDQWMITRSTPQEDAASLESPVVTVHSMAAPRVKGDDEGHQISNGFRQSLRFFQNQVQRDSCPPTTTAILTTSVQPKSKSSVSSELRIERGSTDPTPPSAVRTSGSSAPTVDNILNNVKLIRASQNASIPHPSDAQEKDKSIRASSLSPSSSPPSSSSSSSTPQRPDVSTGRPTVFVTHPTDRPRRADDEETDKKSDEGSDYDSKDFVVHKNTFDERDLVEDAYSSLTEDYDTSEEQSRHAGPDIPSPDYGSSEEEELEDEEDEEDAEHVYQVHHSDDGDQQNGEERDDDFVDNSAAYIADPRRYVYYLDDKELEVIPEEDEDLYDEEEEEEDEFEDHIPDGLGLPSPSDGCEDDAIKTSQTECDSGVTDDQRSSTAEECDLEDGEEDYDRHSNSMGDTDSAKGSLLPDSCSESPTYMEKQGHRSSLDGELLSPEYSQSHERVNGEVPNGLGRYSLFGESIQPSQFVKQNSVNLTEDELKKLDFSSKHDVGDSLKYTSQPEQYFLKNNCGTDSDIEDTSQSRNSTVTWDPTDLLQELYKIEFSEEGHGNSSAGYINLEGYLEKLPTGRKKATYWNPWKRRYFRMLDGFLYCYENSQSEKPSLTLQLMGGNIDTLENNMIGIDDRKGHYIVVRCGKIEDADLWIKALQTQCSENFNLAYVKPVRYPLSSYKDVIIIDLGSCSIRAGILMDQPTLPQVFFPTVCVGDRETGKQVFGMEALHPEVRRNNTLSFPVLPSAKITKYTIDVETLPGLLKKVFQELNVNPRQYKIQVCVPRSFSLQTQIKVAKTLLEDFGVRAINLTHQAILSLYAYNAISGIVVDIGERLDILPIIDGYIVKSGVTRLPYGGQRIIHHLKHALAQKHISMVSDVESFLVRHTLENLCYVAEDYKEELRRFRHDPDSLEASIPIKQFLQEDCPWEEITLDCGRFQAPEGLFTPDLWGLDNPGLHKLVYRAIQECSMDIRKEMARSIYLSGGVTLLPGFIERLESELDKLTPARVIPKVHASPHRYHMAYLGACQLATSKGFEEVCVTLDEWRRHGNDCLQKWHI